MFFSAKKDRMRMRSKEESKNLVKKKHNKTSMSMNHVTAEQRGHADDLEKEE